MEEIDSLLLAPESFEARALAGVKLLIQSLEMPEGLKFLSDSDGDGARLPPLVGVGGLFKWPLKTEAINAQSSNLAPPSATF